MNKYDLKIGDLLIYICKEDKETYGNILKIIGINNFSDSNSYDIINLSNERSNLISPHIDNIIPYISPLKKFLKEKRNDRL